jgi:hypothetical protein
MTNTDIILKMKKIKSEYRFTHLDQLTLLCEEAIKAPTRESIRELGNEINKLHALNKGSPVDFYFWLHKRKTPDYFKEAEELARTLKTRLRLKLKNKG